MSERSLGADELSVRPCEDLMRETPDQHVPVKAVFENRRWVAAFPMARKTPSMANDPMPLNSDPGDTDSAGYDWIGSPLRWPCTNANT
jgi:hypothetical protein